MLFIDKKQEFRKMFYGVDYPFLKGFGKPMKIFFSVTDWNGLNENNYKDKIIDAAKKSWAKSKPNYDGKEVLLITLKPVEKPKPNKKKETVNKPIPTSKPIEQKKEPKEDATEKVGASGIDNKPLGTVKEPDATVNETPENNKNGYVHPTSVEPLVTVQFRKNTIGVAIIKDKPTAYNVSTGKIYQNGFGGAVKALNEYKRQLNDNKDGK